MKSAFLNMNFRKCLVMVLALLTVTACKKEAGAENGLKVSGTWRYKMTVTVEVPEGIKSGYAVREMSNSNSSIKFPNFPEAGNPAKVKGEAVVVDLGKRGKLFATLTGYNSGPNYADSIIYEVFPSGQGGTTVEGIKYYRDLKAGPKVLTPEQYPVLVMFKDIKDPKTVTPVLKLGRGDGSGNAPLSIIKSDHFEELFGEGVKLKEITMEMTDEPVTWGVDQALPADFWLKYKAWIGGLDITERGQFIPLFYFKEGE